jgi:DnaJ family protein C protein 19
VPILVVVLVAGLLLLFLQKPRAASQPGQRGAVDGRWLLAGLIVGFLLLRLGLNWLVVAGGVALTTLRAVAPLLRLLPLVNQWAQTGGATGAHRSDSGQAGAGTVGRTARMSRREALEVLGLDERATREDVQREYRRLVKRLHPDLGGSTYLTAKLNEARDVLS